MLRRTFMSLVTLAAVALPAVAGEAPGVVQATAAQIQ